ncbi:MAG: hypothetical protein H0X36_13205 [Sphingomonadaceae bacterium]|nr:hypothetical protein [Sphingomonadaceae bacterium]
MGILDILKQYADPSSTPTGNIEDHFRQVAQEADPQDLGKGIASAFRSDATPPFGQMVGSLFGQSNPQQQSGVLNQLIQSIGPGALSGLAGGVLGRVLGSGGLSSMITPQQASQLSPNDVSAIAEHAQQHDGSIMDKLGSFYSQHPGLVQTLGTAALGIVMRNMSNR